MVVGDDHSGTPVAYILHSADDEEEAFRPALAAFKEHVLRDAPDWKPSCFIVDDCDAANNAIRYMCSVLLHSSTRCPGIVATFVPCMYLAQLRLIQATVCNLDLYLNTPCHLA